MWKYPQTLQISFSDWVISAGRAKCYRQIKWALLWTRKENKIHDAEHIRLSYCGIHKSHSYSKLHKLNKSAMKLSGFPLDQTFNLINLAKELSKDKYLCTETLMPYWNKHDWRWNETPSDSSKVVLEKFIEQKVRGRVEFPPVLNRDPL